MVPAMVETTRPRVCAVIVTHNRLRTLKLSLNAVVNQTTPPARILVVDNASTDGTRAYLERLQDSKVEARLLPENDGPAGGFAVGFEHAARGPYSHVWAMDDDVVPAPDCLEHLLAGIGDGDVGIPDARSGRGERLVNLAWAGVLVPTKIVHAVGVPDRAYFWWKEDSEYLGERIRDRGGRRLVRVGDAEVLHLSVRTWRRSAWQYYYKARNELHFAWRVQRRSGVRSVLRLGRLFARILVVENDKVAKSRSVVRGVRHALQGRTGKIEAPEASAPARRGP